MAQYNKNGYRSSSTQRFAGFRGLDLYDSPLSVNPARAIDAENFYVRGGEMHKRDGWEEVLNFSEIHGQPVHVNGIFNYKTEYYRYMIVHAGARFYLVDKVPGKTYYKAKDITFSGIGPAKVDENDLVGFCGSNDRSQAFEKDGKLYIIGAGKYLVYGVFFGSFIEPSETDAHPQYGNAFKSPEKLRARTTAGLEAGDYAICYVGNEQYRKQPNNGAWEDTGNTRIEDISAVSETHSSGIQFHVYYYSGSEWVIGENIESTDINTYQDAAGKYELRTVSGSSKTTVPTVGIGIELSDKKTYATLLDDVSLVTDKRKDTVHAGAIIGAGSTTTVRAYSSSKIKDKSHVRVTVKYSAGVDAGADFEDFFVVLENGKNYNGEYGTKLYAVDGSLVQGGESYQTTSSDEIPSGIVLNDFDPTVNFENGYIEFGTFSSVENNAFGVFYTPDASDNITIDYEAADDGDKPIDHCRFGTTFDIDGGSGRLFLSGNTDHKNMDWHSDLDDFTYFGEQSSAVYGQETPITGYIRLTNNTLAVFKKAIAGEASVYYRNGSYLSTEATSLRVFFTITEGSLGKSAVNPSVTWILTGDSMFLADDGVYGIVLTEKFKYDERFAKERGRTVMPQIEKAVSEGFSPTGIATDNRIYVSLGDDEGTVLMCDARQKFVPEDSVDGAYQYEWYRYTGVPARVFADFDGFLWFGTKDGKLARIKKGTFYDRRYHRGFLSRGGQSADFTYNYGSGKVTYSNAMKPYIKEGTALSFGIINDSTSDYYEQPIIRYILLCEASEFSEDNYIYVPVEPATSIYDGMEVYEAQFSDNGISNSYGKIKDVSIENGSYKFRIYNSSDVVIGLMIGIIRIRIYEKTQMSKFESGSPAIVYVKDLDEENQTFKISRFENGQATMMTTHGEVGALNFDVIEDNPVKAYWITPYTSLGSNILEKTLFAITVCPELHSRGKLTFGYETRHKREALDMMQANPMSLEALNFNNFTLETGFAEARNFRVKERNFNYIRFRFSSEDEEDCGINDFSIIFKAIKQYRGIS